MIGREGKTLQQHWDDAGGIGAYKTVAVNGFPNMFYLLGPNAGSGHTSVLFAVEWFVSLCIACVAYCKVPAILTNISSSVNLVIEIARPVLNQRAATVEVCEDAALEWCDTIQSALSKTVLTHSCSNVSACR